MNLFKNYKSKKQLKEDISYFNREIIEKNAEIENLKAILAGDLICGNQCSICTHSITVHKHSMVAAYKTYDCKLKIKCKEFCEVRE